MIFGDTAIEHHILEKGCVVVDGVIPEGLINPASLNISLGDTFLKPKSKPVRLGDKVEYTRWKVKKGKTFMLFPHDFVLATTKEEIKMPNNVAGFVQGRSSIGRIGLTVQNAGFVDPSFHGHITLELVNDSNNIIFLPVGYPVAQLVFFQTTPVAHGYDGKYNGQVEATGSRMYLDKRKGD